MSNVDGSSGLVTRLGAVPIADGALMTKMLRDTLLQHAESGVDVAEPALLGLLAIVGALEDRLAHHEPAPSPEVTA
ncbi:hypothetical protein D4768_21290 [Rhodococcus erythropolis]|uniref:hypothetical protein n=1 Tax=Rhodococcus erythropolis TaxID=1833 RepID=UPI001F3FA20B|nr:hypothetical protein [Rhodococcus erythropolis]UJC79931.1 hypothetical protein D4768_21290 [Rhodococcus erythropolis]